MAAYCAGPAPDTEVAAPAADAAPPGTLRSGPAFTFNQITEDIYHATGSGTMSGCHRLDRLYRLHLRPAHRRDPCTRHAGGAFELPADPA